MLSQDSDLSSQVYLVWLAGLYWGAKSGPLTSNISGTWTLFDSRNIWYLVLESKRLHERSVRLLFSEPNLFPMQKCNNSKSPVLYWYCIDVSRNDDDVNIFRSWTVSCVVDDLSQSICAHTLPYLLSESLCSSPSLSRLWRRAFRIAPRQKLHLHYLWKTICAMSSYLLPIPTSLLRPQLLSISSLTPL